MWLEFSLNKSACIVTLDSNAINLNRTVTIVSNSSCFKTDSQYYIQKAFEYFHHKIKSFW